MRERTSILRNLSVSSQPALSRRVDIYVMTEVALTPLEPAAVGMRVLFMHSCEEPELARTLARDGHDVLSVADDEHAARLMRVFRPEMIVVAAQNTVLACGDLRSQAREVPIIAIVASDDAEERVAALNAGADDCLGRPFHRAELIARMRAAERRRLLIAARPHMDEQPAVGGEA